MNNFGSLFGQFFGGIFLVRNLSNFFGEQFWSGFEAFFLVRIFSNFFGGNLFGKDLGKLLKTFCNNFRQIFETICGIFAGKSHMLGL